MFELGHGVFGGEAAAAEESVAGLIVGADLADRSGYIVTSFPGLAVLTDARVLAEIGDDRTRFKTSRDLIGAIAKAVLVLNVWRP